MRRLLFCVVISFIFAPSMVWAETMAGLQLRFANGTDSGVRADIESAVSSGVKSHKRWSFESFKSTRAKLAPVVRDCFTNDCLKKAGTASNAPFGLRVDFSGEAQIYDWSIEVYDLRNGKNAKSVKGSCELCGRAEVKRTFSTTLTEVLNGVKSKSSSTKTNEVVESEPEERPDPEPIETMKDTPRVQVTEVRIDVEPPDATVILNGEEVGTGSVTLQLSPGSYELQFKREGYQGFKESVAVGESGETKTQLRVHMSKTDPDPVLVRSGEGAIDRLDNRALWGGITLATGSILLVTGIVLSSIDGQPSCSEGTFQDCPSVYATGTGGILLTTTGAVLATAGVGLLMWNLLSGEPEEGDVNVAPTASAGFGGVTISGRF